MSATVPLHRIQTLTIRRGLIHRWFDRASVRVETAGGQAAGEAARGRELLAPIIGERELSSFLRIVAPDLDLGKPVWQGPAAGAFGRELRKRLVLALIGALLSAFALGWWGVFVLAVFVAWAWMSARIYIARLGWAVIDGAVLFRTGRIWRHLTVARFTKGQAVSLTPSPFVRRHHMARQGRPRRCRRRDTAWIFHIFRARGRPRCMNCSPGRPPARVSLVAGGTSQRYRG